MGQETLCLANWQEVIDPPLRMLQTWSAPMRAWEDLRLLGVWNTAAACFDGVLAWQMDPAMNTTVSSGPGDPVSCITASCGLDADVCEGLGMRNACMEDEPTLLDALAAPSVVADAMSRIQSSVDETMQSAAQLLGCCHQLRGHGHAEHELAMLKAQTEVWVAHRRAALTAWDLSSNVLHEHAVQQARTVRQRLSGLTGLLSDAFDPPWTNGHGIVQQAQQRLAAIEGNVTNHSAAYSEILAAMNDGRVVLQQVQLAEWNPLLAQQLRAAQLQLEVSAQLVPVGLQLCALGAAEGLHVAVNDTDCAVLEVTVPEVSEIASAWQATAAQLLTAWKQQLLELSELEDVNSSQAVLRCLGQKAAEARRLIAAYETGSKRVTANGETGFYACRGLHAGAPRIDVAMNAQVLVSDADDAALGLAAVQAKTEDGDRQLRFSPTVATVTLPASDGQRATTRFAVTDRALQLSMPNTFEGWNHGGRRLAEHVESNPRAAIQQVADGAAVQEVRQVPRGRERLLQVSCDSGMAACGADVWCNDATWVMEAVGDGYYSPDGDCSRYACTSMDTEVFGMSYGLSTGDPSYVASGGGVDACPWACGGGHYAQAISMGAFGTSYLCIEVLEGEWSPAGDNSIFQWCARDSNTLSCPPPRRCLVSWCLFPFGAASVGGGTCGEAMLSGRTALGGQSRTAPSSAQRSTCIRATARRACTCPRATTRPSTTTMLILAPRLLPFRRSCRCSRHLVAARTIAAARPGCRATSGRRARTCTRLSSSFPSPPKRGYIGTALIRLFRWRS